MKNKFAKKFLALLLAITMTFAMGITVFATEGDDDTSDGTTSSTGVLIPDYSDGYYTVSVVKSLENDDLIIVPGYTFTFNIAVADTSKSDGADLDEELSGQTVKNGVNSAVSVGSATFVSYSTDESNNITYKYGDSSAEFSLTVSISLFTEPGIYKYVLTEVNSNIDGVTYDAGTYWVYVFVVYDEEDVDGDGYTTDLTVSYVVIYSTTTSSTTDDDGNTSTTTKIDSKTDGLSNSYVTHSDEDGTDYLEIEKELSGDAATGYTGSFSFTITIYGTEGEIYYYDYNGYRYYIEGSSEGKEVTFELKGGESIKIYGLSENDTYVITENDYSNIGFSTTWDNANENDNVGGYTNKTTVSADDYVKAINTRNYGTPTGVVLNYLPYILIVAFAGCLIVLFLRKRRSEF